jgi:hypothetical protein
MVPELSVTFPYIVSIVLDTVPVNPVKFKFLKDPLSVSASEYVPVVKLKLIEFVSDKAPVVTVVAVPVGFETLTTGVPVTVKLVMFSVIQTMPVPVVVMFPVPKDRVRAVDPELEKLPVVRVLPFKARVPDIRVVALVDPTVNAPESWDAPVPDPVKFTGQFSVTPDEVIVLVVPVAGKKLIIYDPLITVDEVMLKFPLTPIDPMVENVTVPADTVKSRQDTPLELIVTV